MKNTALIVAYEFPPLKVGGAMRSMVFSEELERQGWETIVLTPRSPYGEKIDFPRDSARRVVRTVGVDIHLFEKMVSKLLCLFKMGSRRILEGVSWRLRRALFFLQWPDSTVGWAVFNFPIALWMVYTRRVGIVYTTSWPISDHLIGLFLSKITGVKWVADFRDPYLRHFNYKVGPSFRRTLDARLEKMICRNAAAIINPTSAATSRLADDYPAVDKGKFHTIRNGFDLREFSGAVSRNATLTFLHAGAFYLSRKPDLFLEVLNEVIDELKVQKSTINVLFMGRSQEDGFDLASYERYPFVKILEWQPRSVSIKAIRAAHVLLLIRHPECELTVPGKLYEYMASGGFIFVISGERDELEEILNGYPNYIILRNPNKYDLKYALIKIITSYSEGTLISGDFDASKFSRQYAAERLGALMSKLIV